MNISKHIRSLAQIALSAALICIASMISIPTPFSIPFTLQSFAVFSILAIFGYRKGGTAVLIYIALGLVGLPVFSGFSGGFHALIGPTGGFLLGFLLAIPIFAPLKIKSIRKHKRANLFRLGAMILSQLALYAFGTVWYHALYANTSSIWATLAVTVLPFLIPDAVKITLAYFLSRKLRSLFRRKRAR